MDSLSLFLLVLSIVASVVFAFSVFQCLTIVFAWAGDRWKSDWGRRPLLLRVPPRVLSLVCVLSALALVL